MIVGPVPRIIPFIVVAVVAAVFLVVAGVFLGIIFVDEPSTRGFLFLMGNGHTILSALSAAAGRLADRWSPAFREHPDGLILGELRAIPEIAPADLESEILDADCGYHIHRGASTSRTAVGGKSLGRGRY